MRYLVTGGAGFIGSALTRALLGEGHEVTVLDNMSRGKRARLPCPEPLWLTVAEGDVRDPDTVSRAAHGVNAVIHLAYLQGTQTFYAEPRQVLDTAMRGMLNVLAACEKQGVGDLMLMSSSEAYQVATAVPTPETVPLSIPDPLNPRYSYGGGKAACEIMASAWQRAGVLDRAVIARPHNIIGPDMGREHVIPEFAARMNRLNEAQPHGILDFPIQGTGRETRSFCYIDDCVLQLTLLLDRAPAGTQVYHVGQMDERTIADVARTVAACYLREVKVIPGSLPKGSPPRRCPDTGKIQALSAGLLPYPVKFAEAVERTVAWYRER